MSCRYTLFLDQIVFKYGCFFFFFIKHLTKSLLNSKTDPEIQAPLPIDVVFQAEHTDALIIFSITEHVVNGWVFPPCHYYLLGM